jgi:prepilin-type N-terminal cleavage/methylation domain-containing protein
MKRFRTGFPEDGFTLVEILITILVGSIIIGGLSMFIITQGSISQRNRDEILANAFIEGKVEALRSKGFLGINNGTVSISGELPAELKSPRNGDVEITSVNSALKKVVINISYNDQGATRSLSYTTYIGELGAGQY